MSPIEVGVLSHHHIHFNEITNDKLQRYKLKFLEEKSDAYQAKLILYQEKMIRYYNAKVKNRTFCLGRCASEGFPSLKEPSTGTLGPMTWKF